MSPSTESRENREFASELKFLVPCVLGEQIRAWARLHLGPDPHGSGECKDNYRITSLYFDTDQFDVFHRRGSFGRSKYRIRRYEANALAFLERKLKTRGMVSKRRTSVSIDALDLLDGGASDRVWPGRWYQKRLLVRKLRPVCEISYHRTARVSVGEAGLVRLTVDTDLRASPSAGFQFNGSEHGTLLLEGAMIVEMKFRADLPALFKRLVEEFALNPQPVSKYRLAASKLGLVPHAGADLPSSILPTPRYA